MTVKKNKTECNDKLFRQTTEYFFRRNSKYFPWIEENFEEHAYSVGNLISNIRSFSDKGAKRFIDYFTDIYLPENGRELDMSDNGESRNKYQRVIDLLYKIPSRRDFIHGTEISAPDTDTGGHSIILRPIECAYQQFKIKNDHYLGDNWWDYPYALADDEYVKTPPTLKELLWNDENITLKKYKEIMQTLDKNRIVE